MTADSSTPPGGTPTVAVLGVGLMGDPIARRLIASGLDVTVWNRTGAKAAPFAELRARVALDPAEAASGRDVVILMLSDRGAVRELLMDRGVAAAVSPGNVVIDMSSIPPIAAQEHFRLLAERGVEHLDAPVSGGTTGAEVGALTIMVGGSEASFERARPVLSALGTPHLVGGPGAGQLAKCANQIIVGVTIGAVAEAFLLSSGNDIDPLKVQAALLGGFADSRILREHGRRMVERDFTPGGKVAMQLKDLRTALAVARQGGLALPLTECATELFEDLAALAGDQIDHSALLLELERLNGLPIDSA